MRYGLLCFCTVLLLAATSLQMSGQEPKATLECKVSYRHFTPSGAQRKANGEIVPGQAITRLRSALGPERLTVVEHPFSTKDLDLYGSVIIIRQGETKTQYPLGKLIKDGDGLRLIETAELCTSADSGVLFLAFAAGATAASEGFVRISYSPSGVQVRALPMTDQGRISVRRTDLNDVAVWSAADDETGIICEACRKRYSVQNCHISAHGVDCTRRATAGALGMPEKFDHARITIR